MQVARLLRDEEEWRRNGDCFDPLGSDIKSDRKKIAEGLSKEKQEPVL